MSKLEPREALAAVGAELDWLVEPPMFFGAAVLGLYLDREEIASSVARPTEDVDVVVTLSASAASQSSTPSLESTLRARGFTHDQRAHRRNMQAFISPSGVPVDFVVDALFSADDWPMRSREFAMQVRLEQDLVIRIPSPGHYLACKIAASRNRGRWEGDYYNHDLEDIALLLSGCDALPEDNSRDPELTRYLEEWAREVIEGATDYGRDAMEVLLSNVPPAASVADVLGPIESMAERGR